MNEVEAIFGWGRRMSEAIHRDARIRELSAQIRKVRCGDCDKWLKSSICPQERPRGNTGYRTGPSCEGLTCSQFVETQSSTDLRQKRTDEMSALQSQKDPS